MQWIQSTNLPCRQSVFACGYDIGPQENWLITQYINRTISDGTHLPQVRVLVEFELDSCPEGIICERSFVLYKYETSVESDSLARSISKYQRTHGVFLGNDTRYNIKQNRAIELNFDTDKEGFYLAIVDETLCIGVTRVIVLYHVCPGGVMDNVNQPETLAPHFEHLNQPLAVSAQCVEAASPENGVSAMLNCNQGGAWTPVQGSGCRCNPGFIASEDGSSCTGKATNLLI